MIQKQKRDLLKRSCIRLKIEEVFLCYKFFSLKPKFFDMASTGVVTPLVVGVTE